MSPSGNAQQLAFFPGLSDSTLYGGTQTTFPDFSYFKSINALNHYL